VNCVELAHAAAPVTSHGVRRRNLSLSTSMLSVSSTEISSSSGPVLPVYPVEIFLPHPCYHRAPSKILPIRSMETNHIRRALDDLAERSEALRRFL
jgi:hypothetical protein